MRTVQSSFYTQLVHCSPREAVAQRPLTTKSFAPGADPLFSLLPRNSGAEAVEAAIKLARQATNKQNVIVVQGSYHGRTFGTMAMTKVRFSLPLPPPRPELMQSRHAEQDGIRRGIWSSHGAFELEQECSRDDS